MTWNHYYSEEQVSPHNIKRINFRFQGKNYTFLTDAGVFSKDRVDRGTEVLLEGLVAQGEGGDMLLDMGCGYGVVGIVMAPKFRRVYMCDINSRAISMARKNVEAKGIDNSVVIKSDTYTALKGLRFDVIASNPPVRAGKRVVYKIVDEAPEHLIAGGRLYIVVRTKMGAKSLMKHMSDVFGGCEVCARGSGYKVLRSENL